MNKLYIGAHSSISEGYNIAVKNILTIGGNAIQIFLKNPRGKSTKKLNKDDLNITKDIVNKENLFLVGHCSYLLNFAKPLKDYIWNAESLIFDLNTINKLGGKGVVLHIGKYLNLDKETAYKNIIENIEYVFKKTPKETYIILENTAGQGTEIGYTIEELSFLYKLLKKNQRIKFCLDTCHSFAAGYNLSTKEGINKWFEKFDKLIGWKNVICIHFNDSYRELGSRVDRHSRLLEGKIGKEGLKEIAKLCYKTKKPIILETPQDYNGYEKEINLIKKWIKENDAEI